MANWWLRLVGLSLAIGELLNLASPATALTAIVPDRTSMLNLEDSTFPKASTQQRLILVERTTQANPSDEPSSQPIRPQTECPDRLQSLISLMLRDLPSYANRVSQRAYTDYRTPEVPGYMLIAGRPEYEPLPLPVYESSDTSHTDVQQVFFTTLERQYFSDKAFRLQHYHWLFLTQTGQGWRFVLMLSSIGNTETDDLPTPPQDSSQGVIAQAIRLWLRDCEAGFVMP